MSKSPRLQDPQFLEKREITGSDLSMSARDLMLDYQNAFFTGLSGVLQFRARTRQSLLDVLADMEMFGSKFNSFKEQYPGKDYEELVRLQDPEDIQELDVVAETLTDLLAERKELEEQVLQVLLGRAKAVFSKYQPKP